jgi:hypothetical protein
VAGLAGKKPQGGSNFESPYLLSPQIAWGNDGRQYASQGDGWGFAPRVGKKLRLGLAALGADPGNFKGLIILSAAAWKTGEGKTGLKAGGMRMGNGVRYRPARACISKLAGRPARRRGCLWRGCRSSP